MITFKRNLIKKTLSQPDALERVRQGLIEKAGQKLGQFAEFVCGLFDFRGDHGRLQKTSCAQALKELDAKGLISLEGSLDYRPSREKRAHAPRCLDEAVPQPSCVPESVEEIKDLEIVRVESDGDLKKWNTVMRDEHRLGANTPPGRGLKYLAVSQKCGLLAAAAFSSPSLHIKVRDEWLGWSDRERRDSLDSVLATMNRLLIRQEAHRCRNLPSRVVGMLLAAVRRDWPAVYGFEIFLVETFVDPASFAGTTYKASNWIEIGQTAGRGWCDRERKADAGVKTLYVYPLVPDFRRRLGLPEPVDRSVPSWARKGPLGRYEGLAGGTWAEQECGGCDLGHRDRNARLACSVEKLAKSPQFSAGAAMGTDAAGRKGWYRFIESPCEKITAESILGGHRECTLRRMMGFREVLVVQDGMDVNTSGKTGTEGLGPIGSNHPGSVTLGFKEHGSIAVGVEWKDGGIPDASFLGILKASFWSRPMPVRRRGRRRKRPRLPAEKRESHIWIKHAESAEEAGRHMPDTRQIIVGDRGADSALLMYKVAAMKHCGLIVRARSDRRLPGERHSLFTLMAKQPRGRTVAVDLCAKTERRNGAGKILSRGRKERKAVLEIVFRRVRIAPPPEMAGADPLEITCVTAVEVDPPKGEEMIRWHLLTTLPVETHEDAARVVRRYHLRWIVEEFHGMLKSDGCDIESLAYRTVGRMQRAAAVYMLVAWWLMASLEMVRRSPELQPDAMFDEVEQEVLRGAVEEFEKKSGTGS